MAGSLHSQYNCDRRRKKLLKVPDIYFFPGYPNSAVSFLSFSCFCNHPVACLWRHLRVPIWSWHGALRPKPTSWCLLWSLTTQLLSRSLQPYPCSKCWQCKLFKQASSFSFCPGVAVGCVWLLVLDIQHIPPVLFFLSKWCLVGLAVWTRRLSKLQFV